MIGMGTLINTAAVIAGGLLGLCLKNGLKKRMQEILMQACGLATIFIGASGALSKMFVVDGNQMETQGTMLLIFSLVIGSVFSAVPLFVYQGSITLIAAFCGSFISDALISALSFVGSALIFCVGVNLAFGKRFRVGNMLPALIVPMIYRALMSAWGYLSGVF